jgi:hypothetical protein
MKAKYFLAAVLIVALGTGATLATTNARAKANHELKDGNPKPTCPPPPYICE